MKEVSVICSSREHPVYPHLEKWCARNNAHLVERVADLPASGDILFLVSCGEMIRPVVRERFNHVLVLHASDLPRGRGWSPHIWDILEGRNELTLSLLEATEPVDSGDIWKQAEIHLDGTELHDEINEKLFKAELDLMDWAVANCDTVEPVKQVGEGTHWRKRTPEDSQVTSDQTLGEIFDLLRVCDPDRFPAFIEHRGAKYALRLQRITP